MQVICIIIESEILHFLTIIVLVGKPKKTLIFSHFAKEILEQVFDFILVIP